MKDQLIKFAASAAIAGAVLFGASASAQAPEFTFSVRTVNLDDAAEVADVYARLNREAARYCDALIEDGVETVVARSLCREDVVDSVVSRVGHSLLSEYHVRAGGRSGETMTAALN